MHSGRLRLQPRAHSRSRAYPVFKRCVDLALASSAIVVLAPLWIGIGVCVRVSMGSPVLFRQVRLGRWEQPFTLLKFRTMTEEQGPDCELLPDGQRLTKVGALLRMWSLDELPELVNVVKGEMSLVGPRPLLMRYEPYFSEEERIRHSVRPGITGLAQVNGRNAASWDDRLQDDIRYVQMMSLRQDLAIMARTVRGVATGRDVHVDPGAEMLDLDVERSTQLRS